MTDAIDIFDPAFTENPYPAFAAARARGEVEADPIEGWWVLDPGLAAGVLRDPHFGMDPAKAQEGITKTVMESRGHFSILTMDDPDHGRIRGLATKAFTKRTVEAMAPHIQEITDTLLDAVADDEFDLMEALAVPLPIIVIAEILGVDPSDRAEFSRWSRDAALSFNPFLEPDVAESVARSGEEFRAYTMATVESRRAQPRNDLITHLIEARDGEHALSDEEMVDLIGLLLGAGNITTTDLIGNAVLALFRHPEQLELFRADPSLAPAVVEEALRYDSPVLMTSRIALDDNNLGGCPIKKGEWVTVGLAAINHAAAESFDVTRGESHHLSFGGGKHLCLGAPLARLEATVALRTLFTRLPHLALIEQDIEYRSALGFRGLEALRVRR